MIVPQFFSFLVMAAASGEANPLEFKSDLAIWTGVVFAVLLAVLWKFAWKPIAEGLDKREKQIADQIAEAERHNQDARQLLADYQQKLAASQGEVRGILDQAPPRSRETEPRDARQGQGRGPRRAGSGRCSRSRPPPPAPCRNWPSGRRPWPSNWPARSSAASSLPRTTPN